MRDNEATTTAPRQASPAQTLLEDALYIVEERGKTYDRGAERSLQQIARLWSAYRNETITETDVAAMMILLKVARQTHSPTKQDHWADMAGYAALGWESSAFLPEPDEAY